MIRLQGLTRVPGAMRVYAQDALGDDVDVVPETRQLPHMGTSEMAVFLVIPWSAQVEADSVSVVRRMAHVWTTKDSLWTGIPLGLLVASVYLWYDHWGAYASPVAAFAKSMY
jgi:hypothetical protein